MNTKDTEYITEADVETKFIYEVLLRKIFRFEKNNVKLHVPIEIVTGRTKTNKEADVVIYNEKGEAVLVIDSKAPNEILNSHFGQIDSYAFHLEAPMSILSNYYRTVVRIYLSGNKKQIIFDKNISEMEADNFQEFKNLVEEHLQGDSKEITSQISGIESKNSKVVDYRRLFRQIHTKIRSMDKLDPSASFDEFSKVLFIKIINDIITEEDRLTSQKIKIIGNTKSQSKYIDDWFQVKVKEYYPGIFAENVKIALSPNTLCVILDILNEQFDLKDSMTDIKGRAFEEFLPSQLRGKGLGQFFTPRTIVEFMIELADISVKDKILDFASGSGGFLINAFDRKRQLINSMQKQYFDFIGKTREDLIEEIKTQIFGIDAEPRAVRTAKMNMLLWGDGKQIQHGNGLDTKDYQGRPYFAKEYVADDDNSGVDIILANPPFGSTEEDQSILKNYSLSKKIKQKDKNGRVHVTNNKEKTENLFIEKAYKTLRPEGKLLIVLPEGIFSNDDSRVRDYILSHFIIETIVKLPKHTFVMSGVDTINTVILIARKNSAERQKEIKESDKGTWISASKKMTINFASVNQIGYEPSGRVILDGYKSSDLKQLAEKIKSKDYNLQLADPIEYADIEFNDDNKTETWKKSMIKFLKIDFDSAPKRLDPTYYFFQEETKEILSSFVKMEISEKNLIKEKITEKELNEDVEKIYKYVSVIKTLDGNISEIEEKTVDELLAGKKESMPQKLLKNDIVFNPYRINTGSIICIDRDDDNLVTSPAYVVIRNVEVNPEYFVQLLKTPFMKYQIQVLASGSVRDNFTANHLYELKIPNISQDEQKIKIAKIKETIKKINLYSNNIGDCIEQINNIITDY